MQEVLVNSLGGLSLPRKSVVRLTDCPDMTSAVYYDRKTTTQQHATTVYSQIPMQVCNEILSADKVSALVCIYDDAEI